MSITIKTIVPWGIEGRLINIEIDSNKSLPGIDIIGLPDNAVKESKERLRSTFRSCAIEIPPHRFIINLSPSDIKKTGAAFDLPIGVALLSHIIGKDIKKADILSKSLFIGELGLDGSVKGVQGLLSMVITGKKEGYTTFFVPQENIGEIDCIEGIIIYPLQHFNAIYNFICGGNDFGITSSGIITTHVITHIHTDFNDIQGHELIKRAIAIGAVGLHNILMIGPPGTGKSMIAKAIPGILPPMSYNEVIEVSQIYSLSGINNNGLVTDRPFRSIHHTASKISLIGGGQKMSPGEISRAHNGVLFLDELPEFPRDVLDVLRQPIEDKCVTISRAQGSVSFPADCMVVGAMNPCICGYYNDTERMCTCSPSSIKKYQSRISGPLLDRFDIIIYINRQEIGKLYATTNSSSDEIRKKILKAREKQKKRYSGTSIKSNNKLDGKDIKKYITLDNDCEQLLIIAQKKLCLSHRGIHKILKVARTIADYEGVEHISKEFLLEAIQYRSKLIS